MTDPARLRAEINERTADLNHYRNELEQAEREERDARNAHELARRQDPESQPLAGDEESTQIEWQKAQRRVKVLGRIIGEVEQELKSREDELQALLRENAGDTGTAAKEDRGMGNRVVIDQKEKLQLAMDRMWGAVGREAAAAPQDVPAFKGFRHALQTIVGRPFEDMVNHVIANAQEEILAATWVNVLGTSMHKRLIKDYAMPGYGEDAISRPRPGGVASFDNVDALRVQYLADLAVVDPEAADYAEIVPPGDEIVQYHAIQVGGLLTISRKALLSDNLGASQKMVGRIGRAARRTKAKYVWAFAMNNVAYDVDSVAWFDAAHGNLGATALTADLTGANLIITALMALANMTEPGSGETLGLPALRDLRLWLAVPTALLGVAHALNSSNTLPNAGNVQCPNPIYHLFGENDERVIVNPLFTDATDWYVFRDPDEVDSIEIGYVLDQREPQLFVASVPTIGQMFVADKQQFKVRDEYGAEILDYRGGYKAVVAG